jgi:signal transduction histidine kinase
MIDITREKRLMKLLKGGNMQKQLIEQNQSFSQYHELTPLNGIIGFTDLLMKTKLEEIQQNTEHRESIGAYLLEIINDILISKKLKPAN